MYERIWNLAKAQGITKPQLIAKRNQLLSEPTPTPPPDPAVMQKISLSDRNIRERDIMS